MYALNTVSLLQDGITDVLVVPSSTVSPAVHSLIRDQPTCSTPQCTTLHELQDVVRVSHCIVIIYLVCVRHGVGCGMILFVCWWFCRRGDYALQPLLYRLLHVFCIHVACA